MLKGDYWWQVVEIVIGSVPTILEVCFMCLFMSLGKILLQGSELTNLLDPMTHQVDLRKVEVVIQLLVNINHFADLIPPGVHFAPLLGWRPSFSIFSSATIRFFTSAVLRALALAFAFLPAQQSKETSLKV